MKKRNNLSKVGFALDHIWWGVIGWIWYRPLLFRTLGNLTLSESKMIMWSIVLLSSLMGFLINYRYNRNSLATFINLVTGFGIYTVLIYYPIKRTLIMIVLSIVCALALLYAALVLLRKIKDKKRAKNIIKRRFMRSIEAARVLICIGLIVLSTVIAVNSLSGTLVRSSVKASKATVYEETVHDNIKQLELLQKDKWESLPQGKRLGVLQTIANMECSSLRLPHELNVKTETLDADQLGYYMDSEHLIIINLDNLLYGNPYELVDTVCHESYHALEHRLVEAYEQADDDLKCLGIYREAAQYKEEFDHYKDSEDDILGYYLQVCEEDARQHAESAANRYYREISKYLGVDSIYY